MLTGQAVGGFMRISSVRFRNFKALQEFSVSLDRVNVLVGPNNAGKSTILSAFRALQVALQFARARKPEHMGKLGWGYRLRRDALPLSLENVHTNYNDEDSSVEFKVTGGGRLRLLFPSDGGCQFFASHEKGTISGPGTFRKHFDIDVAAVPVLGPVEHEEPLLDSDYVRRSLNSHRASRHFRNFWHANSDLFEDFRALLRRTWPGMDIELPRVDLSTSGPMLTMMGLEGRVPRELYWSGFGFQVWAQLLTHLVRGRRSQLLVLDEPEIYLHPDMQRQLVSVVRDLGPDVILATHSTEIMAEAESTEMLYIDKAQKAAKRIRDHTATQEALDRIGSLHNVTLTQIARNKRLLFVEGRSDFAILRRFAKVVGLDGLAAGLGLTIVESDGFSNWERVKSFAWGLARALDESLAVGAIFDRDFRSEEEMGAICKELDETLHFSAMLKRKEIENYLLGPEVLERALAQAITDREGRTETTIPRRLDAPTILEEITAPMRDICLGQYIARRTEFLRRMKKDDPATIGTDTVRWFNAKWDRLETRVEIVPGKETLHAFRSRVSEIYGVSLSDVKIVGAFNRGDVPKDLQQLLGEIDRFRNAAPRADMAVKTDRHSAPAA
jgi:hypothetical protein